MDSARREVRTAGSRWFSLFVGPGEGKNTTWPVKHPGRHRGVIIQRAGAAPARGKSPLATWAESFIFAGSSALLLLVANLFPHWWYFSFFALTPFLYRIIRASPGESLRLGFLFGLSFFGAATTNSLITSPVPSVLRLISGTALFALFGWTVGRARQRWGFSPSIVAVLWVALELGLMKFGFTGGFVVNEVSLLLGEAGFSQPFLQGLVGLFGFLTVSAIIVLLNSLLVLVVVKTLEKTRPREKISAEDGRIWDFFFVRNLVAERAYLVPEGRAPPFLLVTVFV